MQLIVADKSLHIITPPDVVGDSLRIYPDFIFFSSFTLGAHCTDLQQNLAHVRSESELKMYVQNLMYPAPIGPENYLFSTFFDDFATQQ